MKITDLDYYVKFVFSTDDGEFCFSTTDRDMLNEIKFHNTDNIPGDYQIGDKLRFGEVKAQFEITNIKIKQLIEDTEVLGYGIDTNDCTQHSGMKKDHLLKIQITLKKIV